LNSTQPVPQQYSQNYYWLFTVRHSSTKYWYTLFHPWK